MQVQVNSFMHAKSQDGDRGTGHVYLTARHSDVTQGMAQDAYRGHGWQSQSQQKWDAAQPAIPATVCELAAML